MIQSLENEKVKEYLRLKQKKYRDNEEAFVIEGPHLVEIALKQNVIKRLYTTSPERPYDVETLWISDAIAKKLSDVETHQGIFAICQKSQLIKPIRRVVLLDKVQDPGNVGAMIRTAVAFGFDTIVAEDSADFYQSKVIRSSQGAIFHIQLIADSIHQFLSKHPEMTLRSTALRNAISIEKAPPLSEPFALCFGNEGSGVSESILKRSQDCVYIDMNEMESLNVAVACGIMLYHHRKVEESNNELHL